MTVSCDNSVSSSSYQNSPHISSQRAVDDFPHSRFDFVHKDHVARPVVGRHTDAYQSPRMKVSELFSIMLYEWWISWRYYVTTDFHFFITWIFSFNRTNILFLTKLFVCSVAKFLRFINNILIKVHKILHSKSTIRDMSSEQRGNIQARIISTVADLPIP